MFIQQTTINLNNIRIPSITFEKLLLTSKRCPLGIKMVFNFANFIIFNIYFTAQFYMIILKKTKNLNLKHDFFDKIQSNATQNGEGIFVFVRKNIVDWAICLIRKSKVYYSLFYLVNVFKMSLRHP